MRAQQALAALPFFVLLACEAAPEPAPADEPTLFEGAAQPAPAPAAPAQPGPAAPLTPQPGKAPPGPPDPTPAPMDPSVSTHPEVVYVTMAGKDGYTWFCTGALVSRRVVVTAAHCLQASLFESWQVIAPSVTGSPRVTASRVAMYDGSWWDVAHPDLGIVVLSGAIDLAAYAQLTDISATVDAGNAAAVATIVRKAETPEAPLMKTNAMQLTSTIQFGYEHGYGVPMYSHGGDSGAGVFLVEKNQMSHKLVGVEREPDPERGIDHLSRVDAAFIAWVAANGT